MDKDYYQLLNIGRDASQEEIRKAFRRLAMKHHPDRNQGNTEEAREKFTEMKEAYDVLSNPEKRQVYDQYGKEGLNGFGGPGGPGGMGGASINDIFGDIFGAAFGGGFGGGQQQRQRAEEVMLYRMSLSLEQAFAGAEKTIEIPKVVSCGKCDGSGARPGSSAQQCPGCNGSGMMRSQKGFFSVQTPCSKCGGRGQYIADPCGACRGEGKVRQQTSIKARIPPGIDDGQRIQVDSQLVVEIELEPHPVFTRREDDLHTEVCVDFIQAILGCSVEVPTLDGRVELKIPAGTQPNKVLRVRNKGIGNVRNNKNRGDLYCHLTVEIPVKLSKDEIALIEQLDEKLHGTGNGNGSAGRKRGKRREKDCKDHYPLYEKWRDKIKGFLDDFGR